MTHKHKVMTSLVWKFLERGATQAAQFLVSILLARLLSPEDFGLLALVLIFISLANIFVQSGLSTALIQKKYADEMDFSSVFYVNLALAGIVYAILYVAAPYIAAFFGHHALTSLLRVLGITLFFAALSSVQEAYVMRQMQFKKLFYRSIGAVIPAGLIGIWMAYRGCGVWALAGQHVTSSMLICIIMWLTVKWRPQFQFSVSRVGSLFSFGWKLLVSALLDTGYNNLRSLVIGKMFEPTTLGYYSRGSQFPNLLIVNINASIQSVMLPTFSAVQDERYRMKHMMRRTIVISSFIIFPMMAGLAAVGFPLIRVLLGEKWLPCVPFLQIYCFIYAFWPIHTSNLSAINALGRSDIFLRLAVIKQILGLMILAGTVYIFQSAIGIALGGALSAMIGVFLNTFPNKKLLNYGYVDQLKDIAPSFLLSIAMGGAVWGIGTVFTHVYIQLICQVLCGGVIYLGAAKILRMECVEYILQMVKDLKSMPKGMRNL